MLYTKEKIEKLQKRWTTPKGKEFVKKIKSSRCYLSPVLFRKKVKSFPGINDKEVEDGIDLRGAPLSGFDFRVAVKGEDDGYKEEIAILTNIHFEGAIMRHCTFEDGRIHDCYFEGADLKHAEFKTATLNNCNFQEADCSGIDLHGAKLINCQFHDAIIKDVTLDTTIVDQRTSFGEALKSEKEGSYHFASIEYKQIKEMYKNSTLHNIADNYHYREMVAKRKMLSMSHPYRWLSFIFGDLLSKYGTSFVRILGWSVAIMFVCALFYAWNHSLLFHNEAVEVSFLDSFYFSIVSFTTLGYGDYHAVDTMRYLAAAEAFIGAALMALFTVIVARNIIRD